MVFSGEIGQTYYAADMPQGYPGQILGMGNYRALPYLNNAAGVQPVYTITPPDTVDATATYSVSIDGEVVSVTSGGSTTTAQLGTLLYNAIRSNALVFRKVDASLNGTTGVVTLTGRYYNVGVTITSPSNSTTTNDLTIATSTAAGSTAPTIPYGRFVGKLSSYTVDDQGVSAAALVAHASNYTVVGVTMKSFHEKVGTYSNAVEGYPFQSTMSVLEDCSEIEGIWVECVESNIAIGNTIYIAVGAGNEGKLTTTSSGNVALSSNARVIRPARLVAGKYVAAIYYRRLP